MVFSSAWFLFGFLPAFLVMYHAVPRRQQNTVLLAFSLLFYAWGAPLFIGIVVASLCANFYIVRAMDGAEVSSSFRQKAMWLSVVLNVGLLGVFKYANFSVDNLNELLVWGGSLPLEWTPIALPVGISFFTFQSLSYTLDVYNRRQSALDKPTDFLLFILMFPQLIAGPIVRYTEVADDLTQPDRRAESTRKPGVFWDGFYRFALGLGKKVLLANVLAEPIEGWMSDGFGSLSQAEAWAVVLGYTFQIYFDFSGYSDMAIGLGKMMGYHFPENFDHPYTSLSITEFWRRWHMTLGRFMREYVYVPLGGNRLGVGRMYLNLWLVFLISGLWHGAAWNFVFWGAWHGLFIVLERLFLGRWLARWGRGASVYTFAIVAFGWIPFQMPDAATASKLFNALWQPTDAQTSISFGFIAVLSVSALLSYARFWPRGEQLAQRLFSPTDRMALRPLWLMVFLISAAYIVAGGFNPFIYFRF